MNGVNQRISLRITCIALLSSAAIAGCAGHGSGSASVGFSYGAYYGSPWGAGYHVNGPVYVGPPNGRPSGGARPPQASQLPSRPMPQSRPSGGGRRR